MLFWDDRIIVDKMHYAYIVFFTAASNKKIIILKRLWSKKKYNCFCNQIQVYSRPTLVLLQILELNLAHVMFRNASITSCSGMEVAEEAFII